MSVLMVVPRITKARLSNVPKPYHAIGNNETIIIILIVENRLRLEIGKRLLEIHFKTSVLALLLRIPPPTLNVVCVINNFKAVPLLWDHGNNAYKNPIHPD